MGVALADGPEAIHRVAFAPLIAGDHARGNAQVAHQHHEGVGDVFAEALLAVEPESVRRIRARGAGFERVGVAARAQPLHRGCDQGVGAGLCESGIGPERLGQCPCAWIGCGRRIKVRAQLLRRGVGTGHVVQGAGGAVAQHVGDGAVGDPFVSRHLAAAPAGRELGRLHGDIEQQQPLLLVGLQQYLVAHGGGGGGHQSRCGGGRAPEGEGLLQRVPLMAVEALHHRPPEVQKRLWRRLSLETHPEGHAVIFHQPGNVAQPHVARQARARHVVGRHAPQWRKAWEEHKQHQHQRRAPGGHAQGNAEGLAQRWVAGPELGVDQPGQQRDHADQNACCRGQRLRIEEVAQQRKEAEEEDHEGVAPGAKLEGLEHQQQHDQRAAGIASGNGMKVQRRASHAGHEQCHAHGHAGQRLMLPRHRCAPGQQPSCQGGCPERNVGSLEQHDPGRDAEQEQGVPAFARPSRRQGKQPAKPP